MSEASQSLSRLRMASLALAALLLPFPLALVDVGSDPTYFQRTHLYVADLPLLAATALALPSLLRRLLGRSLGLMTALWLTTTALMTLSLLLHPSLRGVETVARAFAVIAVAVTLHDLPLTARRFCLYALVASAAIQVAWAIAQVVNGGPLGLFAFGEFANPLNRQSGMLVPRGTMVHPYVLAALCTLAAAIVAARLQGSRSKLRVAAGLLLIPVGLSYSRAAALGGALVTAMTARGRDYGLAIALVLGFVVPAALTSSGWLGRVSETVTTSEAPPLPEARESLLAQGLAVIGDAPLFGVGPGRYLEALVERGATRDGRGLHHPVHAVPLLVAAEAGILAGGAALGVVVIAIARILRARPSVAIVAGALVAPYLLDHFTYTQAQGVALFAFWLGLSDLPPEPGDDRR